MNADFREAARRIQTIGNWELAAGGSIAALVLLLSAVQALRFRSLDAFSPIVVLQGIALLLPGIATRLLAWVVDALAGPSIHEDAQTRALARGSK
ncbi:MAG: hypothetical protein ACLGSD_01795 [Acidobacteriota bacterium]